MLVHDFLSRSADRWPAKEMCVYGGSRMTYADIELESNRVANALLESGVRPGDRVAVYLDNRPETVIAIFGILKAGAAFVIVNPTTKPDKLCYMLNDCAAVGIVTGGRSPAALEAVCTNVNSVRVILTCDDGVSTIDTSARFIGFHSDLPAVSEAVPPRRCIDMDLAAIIYTSGSTGGPKGVAVTHRNISSAAESIIEYLQNTSDDIILNVLPLSFDYGLYQVLMAARVGGTLVLEQSFGYPYQVVQRIRDERVTGFPGVPTVFALLIRLKDLDPAIFDGVRYVTNTAAALPPAHILRLRELFRKARIYSMYGVTEAKRVSYLPPEEVDRRPTSVGRGMPNEQVYIVDEDGNRVGPGKVGELVVRGSNVMQGYWGKPEETAKVLRTGLYPWEKVLYTGDLFTMDEEGYLYFVGRKDDIIKSRGEKVSPHEVESVICELPGVREVAVVGVPDEILGEAIKAVVVIVDGAALSEREIIGHCAGRLESHMVPKFVEFSSELPKTVTGKVRRKSLAAIAPAAEGSHE